MEFRYSLDRSSRKFNCPQCGKRRMVRYKDNESGTYLPDYVGRCDREHQCAYHFTPKMFFQRHPQLGKVEIRENIPAPVTLKNLSTVPPEFLLMTLKRYEHNYFVQWLYSLFDAQMVKKVVELYRIGTSIKWNGATVFWQIDGEMKIRQAKVMLYHATTGKRVKEDENPNPGTSKVFFAGKSILRKKGVQEPELKQCFFGEHLLEKCPGKIVSIVESEKTAVLMTIFSWLGLAAIDCIWLATGGKNGCRWSDPEVASVLKGRKVLLFPDLGAYQEWKTKSLSLVNYQVLVSDILEINAKNKDRQKGLDMADYYLAIYHSLRQPTYTTNNQYVISQH